MAVSLKLLNSLCKRRREAHKNHGFYGPKMWDFFLNQKIFSYNIYELAEPLSGFDFSLFILYTYLYY